MSSSHPSLKRGAGTQDDPELLYSDDGESYLTEEEEDDIRVKKEGDDAEKKGDPHSLHSDSSERPKSAYEYHQPAFRLVPDVKQHPTYEVRDAYSKANPYLR